MNTIQICTEKLKGTISEMSGEAREFGACEDGMYVRGKTSIPLWHIFNWTTGFFDGMAALAYAVCKDKRFLDWIENRYGDYLDKVTVYKFETMHDLGFLYSPSAVMMYRLTGDEKYKELGILAADALIKRYVPNGHYIKAWGRMDNVIPPYVDKELAKDHFFTQSRSLAIIDCMMNLPLLFWASEVSGQPIYRNIAAEHIKTVLKLFIRKDGSVYHAYRFDEQTGEPVCGTNYCGYSEESFWARGAAWMIYGLAIAYGYEKNEEHLKVCKALLERFINNCEPDGIPLWDFRLPKDKPAKKSGNEAAEWDETDPQNTEYAKDTSAAAIVVCAIVKLQKILKNDIFDDYRKKAFSALEEKYFNKDTEINAFLSHSNGNMTYTSYGDYFFMEAAVQTQKDIPLGW